MSGIACPYCKSPARANPCWYGIDHPEQEDAGAYPPCLIDIDEEAREKHYKDIRRMLLIALGLSLAFGFAVFTASRS